MVADAQAVADAEARLRSLLVLERDDRAVRSRELEPGDVHRLHEVVLAAALFLARGDAQDLGLRAKGAAQPVDPPHQGGQSADHEDESEQEDHHGSALLGRGPGDPGPRPEADDEERQEEDALAHHQDQAVGAEERAPDGSHGDGPPGREVSRVGERPQ